MNVKEKLGHNVNTTVTVTTIVKTEYIFCSMALSRYCCQNSSTKQPLLFAGVSV